MPHSDQPARSWFSVRKLIVLLLIASVFGLIPFVTSYWLPKSPAELIRDQGGEIQYTGNLPPVFGTIFGGIRSITIPVSKDVQVTDEVISSLGEQRHLSVLTLGNTQNHTSITDQGLIALKNYPLRYLIITGGSITDTGLNELRKSSTLVVLSLNEVEVTGEQFQTAPAWTKLESLQLSGSKITNAGLKQLCLIPNLLFLNLSNTSIDGEGLQYLSILKKLSDLNLDNTNIEPDSLNHLSAVKPLRSLSMQGASINDAHVRQISNVTQIEFLMLNDSQVTDQGLIPLTKMENLKKLFMSNTNITDAGVAHFIHSENLLKLDLSNTLITDQVINSLLKFPQLKVLNLSEGQLSDDAIHSLQNSGMIVYFMEPSTFSTMYAAGGI